MLREFNMTKKKIGDLTFKKAIVFVLLVAFIRRKSEITEHNNLFK